MHHKVPDTDSIYDNLQPVRSFLLPIFPIRIFLQVKKDKLPEIIQAVEELNERLAKLSRGGPTTTTPTKLNTVQNFNFRSGEMELHTGGHNDHSTWGITYRTSDFKKRSSTPQKQQPKTTAAPMPSTIMPEKHDDKNYRQTVCATRSRSKYAFFRWTIFLSLKIDFFGLTIFF